MSDPTAAEIAERLEDSYSRRSSVPLSGWEACGSPDRSFRAAAVEEVVMPLLGQRDRTIAGYQKALETAADGTDQPDPDWADLARQVHECKVERESDDQPPLDPTELLQRMDDYEIVFGPLIRGEGRTDE